MSRSEPLTKADLATLEMFILDILRHDEVEQISSMVRMLNDRSCIGWRDHWPHDFVEDEVLAAAQNLVERGDVAVLQEDAGGEFVLARRSVQNAQNTEMELWYRMTPAGRAAWENWDPPT